MESKYDNIKELPKKGNCLVNSDEGIAIQIILSKKGHYWKFIEDESPTWDPTRDDDASAWWDEYNLINGEKYYILNWYEDLRYTWTTAISSVSFLDHVIKFDEYFKEKENYDGYFTGKRYGV